MNDESAHTQALPRDVLCKRCVQCRSRLTAVSRIISVFQLFSMKIPSWSWSASSNVPESWSILIRLREQREHTYQDHWRRSRARATVKQPAKVLIFPITKVRSLSPSLRLVRVRFALHECISIKFTWVLFWSSPLNGLNKTWARHSIAFHPFDRRKVIEDKKRLTIGRVASTQSSANWTNPKRH